MYYKHRYTSGKNYVHKYIIESQVFNKTFFYEVYKLIFFFRYNMWNTREKNAFYYNANNPKNIPKVTRYSPLRLVILTHTKKKTAFVAIAAFQSCAEILSIFRLDSLHQGFSMSGLWPFWSWILAFFFFFLVLYSFGAVNLWPWIQQTKNDRVFFFFL